MMMGFGEIVIGIRVSGVNAHSSAHTHTLTRNTGDPC